MASTATRSTRPSTAILAVATILFSTMVVAIRSVEGAKATSGGDPYSVPLVVDTNPDPTIVETTIVGRRDQRRHRQRRHGPRHDLQRRHPRPRVPPQRGRHRDRALQERPAQRGHRHPLARHRAQQRQRRHAAHPEPDPSRGLLPLQVQGHPARHLLVPPAPPLVDQPGVPGPLRLDHRHRPQRGRPRHQRHAPQRQPHQDRRPVRHHSLQGGWRQRRPDLRLRREQLARRPGPPGPAGPVPHHPL